jgi:hypothetical protein
MPAGILPSMCSLGLLSLRGSSRLPSSAASRSTDTDRCLRFFLLFNGTLGGQKTEKNLEKILRRKGLQKKQAEKNTLERN